jgi:ORF6N domain
MPKTVKSGVPIPSIEHHIHVIRDQKVMLDSDLAALYGVPTKRFNEAVKRNLSRFPERFMLRLTKEEAAKMRSQFATASKRNIRYQPLAFTEHGVVMLSAVLNSERAVQMSILVVEAFVRLREMIVANKDLAARVEKLEHGQRQVSSIIEVLVDEIDRMKTPPDTPKRKIGFDL